jgi:hypothetical protein
MRGGPLAMALLLGLCVAQTPPPAASHGPSIPPSPRPPVPPLPLVPHPSPDPPVSPPSPLPRSPPPPPPAPMSYPPGIESLSEICLVVDSDWATLASRLQFDQFTRTNRVYDGIAHEFGYWSESLIIRIVQKCAFPTLDNLPSLRDNHHMYLDALQRARNHVHGPQPIEIFDANVTQTSGVNLTVTTENGQSHHQLSTASLKHSTLLKARRARRDRPSKGDSPRLWLRLRLWLWLRLRLRLRPRLRQRL